MELMKGLRLEKLYDLLHDSKNIAISQTYFAKRIQTILKKEKYPDKDKLDQALEIILEGSNRLQEMFLILYGEGKEAVIDVTEVGRRRFRFYQETMKEMKKDRIHFLQKKSPPSLQIRCVPFHFERVVDNLLSNAVAAIPDEGGEVTLCTWQQDLWVVMEITNTGWITKEELEGHLHGEGEGKRKGRGLHVCNQLIRNMGGEIEAESKDGYVIFRLKLPVLKL